MNNSKKKNIGKKLTDQENWASGYTWTTFLWRWRCPRVCDPTHLGPFKLWQEVQGLHSVKTQSVGQDFKHSPTSSSSRRDLLPNEPKFSSNFVFPGWFSWHFEWGSALPTMSFQVWSLTHSSPFQLLFNIPDYLDWPREWAAHQDDFKDIQLPQCKLPEFA